MKTKNWKSRVKKDFEFICGTYRISPKDVRSKKRQRSLTSWRILVANDLRRMNYTYEEIAYALRKTVHGTYYLAHRQYRMANRKTSREKYQPKRARSKKRYANT